MSDPNTKFKKSKRLAKTANAIKKQLNIAKTAWNAEHLLKHPHRFAKHHALDCGNPECLVCHSEKIFRKPTLQERKFVEAHKGTHNDYTN